MQYLRFLIVLIVLVLGYFWYTSQYGGSTADTTTPTMEVAPTATLAESAPAAEPTVAPTEPAAAATATSVPAPETATTAPVAATATAAATATVAPQQKVVTFSEADINDKMTAMNTDMVSISGVVFTKDDVAVTMTVSGIKGVFHTNLVAENGKIVLKDSRMEGRLRMIPVAVVATPMQEAINKQLQGKTPIEQVRVLDGSLEITFAAE